MAATHEVFNQSVPLQRHSAASNDLALMEALEREGAAWALDDVVAFGARVGDPGVIALGELAHACPPVLRAFDRYGHRIDEVDYHPAYHQLMAEAVANGLHTGPWSDGRPGAHVARAAKVALWTQVNRWRVPLDGPQVVLLGGDERSVPGHGAHRRRSRLLRRAQVAAR
jgi:putative acyl-CoA dehydrogenase